MMRTISNVCRQGKGASGNRLVNWKTFPPRLEGVRAVLLQILLAGALVLVLISERPWTDDVIRVGSLFTIPALLAAAFLPVSRSATIVALAAVLPFVSRAMAHVSIMSAVAQSATVVIVGLLTMAFITARSGRDRARRAQAIAENRVDRLSLLAHELRTPLAAVMGYADLIDVEETSAAPSQYVKEIQRAADRLNAVVDEILQLNPWWLEVGSTSENRSASAELHLDGRAGHPAPNGGSVGQIDDEG